MKGRERKTKVGLARGNLNVAHQRLLPQAGQMPGPFESPSFFSSTFMSFRFITQHTMATR